MKNYTPKIKRFEGSIQDEIINMAVDDYLNNVNIQKGWEKCQNEIFKNGGRFFPADSYEDEIYFKELYKLGYDVEGPNVKDALRGNSTKKRKEKFVPKQVVVRKPRRRTTVKKR